jgi:hypothetical protein
MFSVFVDIGGDIRPNSGDKEQTIVRLFGGNPDAWAAFDPATVMTKHGPYTGVSALFEIPGNPNDTSLAGAEVPDEAGNPEGQDLAAKSLCALGGAIGIRCAVAAQPGKHDWPFAAQCAACSVARRDSISGFVHPDRRPTEGARHREVMARPWRLHHRIARERSCRRKSHRPLR